MKIFQMDFLKIKKQWVSNIFLKMKEIYDILIQLVIQQ